MTAPKISIVIPTFNRGWLLPRAVDSILAQDFEKFEIIIADDCSTDNTPEVVKRYSGDKRVVYKRNPVNVGKSNANMNVLNTIPMMKSKWGIFMGDDDYLGDCRSLSNAVRILEENPDCTVLFNRLYNNYGYSIDFKTDFEGSDRERILISSLDDVRWVRDNYLVGFVWDKLMFQEMLRNTSSYESNFEDYIFGKKIAYSPDIKFVLGVADTSTNQIQGAEIGRYFEARAMRVISYYESMVRDGADAEELRKIAFEKIRKDMTKPHTTAFLDFTESDFNELSMVTELFCSSLGKSFANEMGMIIKEFLTKRYESKNSCGLKTLKDIFKTPAEKDAMLKRPVIAIYGTTGFAEQVHEHIKESAEEIYFIDDFSEVDTFMKEEVISVEKAAKKNVDTYFLCSGLPATIRKMAENLLENGVDRSKIVSMV